MIIALTINKNKPKVKIVMGRVRNTKSGFIKNCNIAKTIAAKIAVVNFSTTTPLRIYGSRYTATAVNNNRISPDICNLSLVVYRSEEHTSELQSRGHLVCRLLLEKKKKNKKHI